MVVQLKKIPIKGNRCVAHLVLAGDDEHRLNPDSIADINKALDEVENDASASALLTSMCGHAVAGGCMMALAHDYRFMRSDRGFIMLNEVEIKLPLTPGMNAIIKGKLPTSTYHEAVLTAHRYVGKSAAIAGIIHQACPDVASTIEAASKKSSELASKNYDRSVYKALKVEMFKSEVYELLHGSLKGVPESLARAAKL